MYLKLKKKCESKKVPRTFSLNEQTANQNKKANTKNRLAREMIKNALSNV